MPLMPVVLDLLSRASHALGFETLDRFPRNHLHARTHWDRAYFDIASDLKPEAIERSLCDSIANTPSIFAHIANPTPAMQRTLLGVIDTRLRRSCGAPSDLVLLLIEAYRSPYTMEARPGLRTAIEASAGQEPRERVHATLAFLGAMPAAFDVIEAS
ncbi:MULTISPECIES: hypothetical protein [unclassified Massilia]|uniref:hypothetical protein n=1 Tax=unclassified Massilia TaxID=2609279 RepID=UPI00178519C7|nr:MULTISPECIES: hypothetical protein [unclassified Massilia]MBD8532325.1 hypothetical protein [Massilia sp. CFBP 13647]MBD8673802.1 hypothetical protein [Massilia sp. CFBP 13721]